MGKGVERGTRLPESWWPSEELFQWAREERPEIPAEDLRKITTDFVDYWVSEPGKKACKLNWNRTYQRWIRNHIVRKRNPYLRDNTSRGFVC